MLPPALVIRVYRVMGRDIRSGFGSVSVVDTNLVLTGTLGEGPARFFERELFFAWFLLGITCLGVLAPIDGVL